MDNLFAYGTLMCEDILQEVSGHRLTHEPAVLKGYCRRGFRRKPYPGLVPDESGYVEGVFYRSVPPEAWDRLDGFEGEMYSSEGVSIELNDGSIWPASTYVVRPAFRHHLEVGDWNFTDFLHNGKASFWNTLQA